jgi:lysophospholipase L1-like esterase
MNQRLTDLIELSAVQDGDFLYVVDVSDPTDGVQGTGKKITKFNMNLDTVPYLGSVSPSSTPTGTGKAYWFALEDGTYTNFGGVVVLPNSIAIISRDSANVYSISQNEISLTGYVKFTDVVNTLVSTSGTLPLSANQGRALKQLIDDKPNTPVVDGLTSTLTTSALSANQGRVLNADILGGFDAVDITKTVVTDFNTNIAVNQTTIFDVTNLVSGKTYIVTAQTADTLPSGLVFYDNNTQVIQTFLSNADFLSGVSFIYTPTLYVGLRARTFVTGKNIVFTVTHNEFVSPINALYSSVSNTKVIDYLNFTPSVTTVYLYSEFSKYAGKLLSGNITAQYTGTFTIYGTVNGVFTTIYNVASTNFASGFNFSFTVPLLTTEISFRFWQNTSLINNVTLFNPEITPNYLPFGGNQWDNKSIALYGDSITAISNGNFYKPIQTLTGTTNWGNIIGKLLNLSAIFGRGVGGQRYAFGTAGGSVAFINADGTLHSRSDAFNYDNYAGNVTVPAGTIPTRGAYSSWIRIKTMFPASIKNTIDAVIVMGGTNDVVDTTAVSWVAGSTVDAEWASSTEYATYGGDYNLNTLEGGMASTLLKFQAWMPNARFIFATPLGGRSTTGALNLANPVTEEYTKSITIRRLANIFSIPLIDINAEAGVNGVNTNIYLADGIHPYNRDGNKALAMGFLGGLRKIFPRL